MSPFLFYIARSGLYLSLFYAFYLLVMRRTTFFRLNRVLLLAGSYLCLLLPLIRLRTVTAAGFAGELTLVAAGEDAAGAVPPAAAFPWQVLLLALYLAGALATLVLVGVSARKLILQIRKGEAVRWEDCRLVLLDEDIPSFNWGRTVVMSREDLARNPAIFTHERMHMQCRHSLDLLLFLPIQLLFWWNPLMWITREELRLLHEYEADEGVIQNGIDATQYQLLLVRKAVGEQRFSLASGFQHAQLKNRIAMMLKPSSSGWMRWSYLALIPVLAVFMYACNSPRKNKSQAGDSSNQEAAPVAQQEIAASTQDQDPVPYLLVEKKPSFNGGDAKEFSRWVNAHLKYPDQAKNEGAQGRVMVQFTIGVDGVVRDVELLRSPSELLGAEAVRVISSSPKWEPGMQEGKTVPVTFAFPIVFQLK